MKKKIIMVMCILMAVMLTSCTEKPMKTDTDAEKARIISTSVSVCEIMDQLNLDLVGVPQSSFQLPERYKGIQTVGLPMSPDMEIIKSLKPTDIVGPNALQYDLKPKYDNVNIPSTFLDLMSVEDMMKSIEALGEKYDRVAESQKIVEDFQNYMAEYNAEISEKNKPKVLILMGLPGSYMVATEKSYVGSLVKLAGGENVFDGDQAFLNLNTEAIVQTDPGIILRAAHGMPEEVQKSFDKEFRENDIWKHFGAVQSGEVYDLDYEVFNMSASLDYQDALDQLYALFYK